MGKRGKNKARSGQKDKRVSNASSKTASQESITNIETSTEEVVAVKAKRVCPHLDKGIDLEKVSAKLKSSEPHRCEDCRHGVGDRRASKGKGKQGRKKGGAESKESKAIWVCLECGHFSCGGVGFPTTPQCHAVRHARQHRHPLAVQFENPQLRWCFPCNTIIPVEKSEDSGEQKDVFHDIAKLIKGRSSEGPGIDVEDIWFGSGSVTSEIKSECSVSIGSGVSATYKVRGLVNLGNTCFFNSVMQNLLSMDKLREYFSKLDGFLGPLTASLKKLYIETNPETGPRGVINPRSFFGCVCAKAPQFRGYQQHDSHELLHCLLDALCTEESSARKQMRSSQEDVKSRHTDSIFVDAIFGGQLSSTVSCLECGHSSTVYEPFLDLSLPVPTKKPPSRKAQPVSRAKKPKPPPKRSGRMLSKVKKDANILPAKCAAADQPTGDKSSSQVQPGTIIVDQSITLLGDSIAFDASRATASINETDLVSHNLFAAQNVESKEGTEGISGNLVVTDDSTWLDYLEPDVPSVEYDMDSKIGDDSVKHGSGAENVVLSDSLSQNTLEPSAETTSTRMDEPPCSSKITQLDLCRPGKISDQEGMASNISAEFTSHDTRSNDAVLSNVNLDYSLESGNQVSFNGSNDGVSSSGKLWEDEIPMQVQDCPVILLPYKEDTSVTETLGVEDEASSSAVGCEQGSLEFDGFGDLFNEPEAEPSKPLSSVKSAEASAATDAGFLVGNGSESDPDEVDNSDVPVSVESCLSYFIKPELLSKEEHAWQCENCSKVLQKEKIKVKKKLLKPRSPGQNHPNSSVLENHCNGIIEKDDLDSDHDSQQPHNGEMNDTKNGMLRTGEKDELEPVVSQSDDGKHEREYASYDSSQLSNTDKSCCGGSHSNEIDEPASVENHSDTVKHVGSNSLAVDSQSDGSEDEEMDTENVKVKRDATKRILIDRAPPILTVHLKRFSQDARGRLSKLNGHVVFRDAIDLRPFMDPRCTERDRHKYRLLGVVEHLGTMRGGHYVAYVRGGTKGPKGPETGNEDFMWYHASDAYVREATLEEVLRCEAYILFYEQI